MKKIILILLLLPTIIFAQQKKQWIDNYWLSTNLSLLFSTEKRGTAISVDIGRNVKHNFKIGLGYSFLLLDVDTKVDVINAYLEKSINAKNNALFFFVKPGIAIPKKAEMLASKISPYQYEHKKNGFNIQLGSGIRWKVNRHSFFMSAGYNITNYSFTTKEYVQPVNPYNPFVEDAILHNYKWSYSNIFVNLGFTL
jgi:hypothetical protein